jgi:PTS system nitrogen regulatory IIA component
MAEILSPDSVYLDLGSCRSKRQVLNELARLASETLNVDRQELLGALLERERLGTTGIGHGIAIPHAKLGSVKRVVALFARLDRPVDFEALDEHPSDLIVLLLAPLNADTDSLKALARISRVLRSPNLRQSLRTEGDPRTIYRLLTGKSECHAA